MTDPAVVALARALAEASSEEELAGLARAEAEADGTWRLRAAVALLRRGGRRGGNAGPGPRCGDPVPRGPPHSAG